MADSPIKTQIMVALGEALEAITELKTVNRFKGKPIDLDVVPLPALYFYDDNESRVRNNRLQNGVINLVMAVFMPIPVDDLGSQKFSDDADIIQAKVHGILFGSENLLPSLGVIMIQEEQVNKDYPNDEYGILIIQNTLTYAHKFGDAFTTNTD